MELLFLHRRKARVLVEAATRTFGEPSRAASALLAPFADHASRRWLEKASNPYLAEISGIAAALGIPGVYVLNLCFEWGCTGGVWHGDDGPLLRRVLDWPFPLLGENIVVAHQKGPAGDFFNVTWPGLSGVLQASAPGRFAAAINQAPMRRRGAGLVGDWALGRIAVKRTFALPPSHLLRHVFETVKDFATAKDMLCHVPVAVPAIFILSGIHSAEGCVIERTENAFAVRGSRDGPVCATNHFESHLNHAGHGWRARPIDSPGRLASAYRLGLAEDFSWFVPPIANINTRLVMVASAAKGMLAVMGTTGERPVTETFDLPTGG
ncbi:MAG: hypothetical protein KGI68_08065 [Alphaproteobacteria bacterium]|nr:hypothetical protein [Alphaproteobacteria bacterium]MDE1986095.1 hypothetical protein [Alphaproteobacteria bacterium]MDE2264425.1 hypothetical protein [Alphaproteobacteria bacterium]MDE2499206.1 hypothetical protein [Alphaproteobacteria bacterium]